MSEVRRRQFLIVAGALFAAPLGAQAQRVERTYRVAAVLTTSPIAEMAGPEPTHPMINGFFRELRALGYVEGQNLVLERRTAEGSHERYSDIVTELVRLKTDVIVTAGGSDYVGHAKKVTSSVPIVTFGSGYLVENGLVASLSRPGGNITGLLFDTGPENEGKRLQLLKETIPTLSRVAYLGTMASWKGRNGQSVRDAAQALGIELLHAELQLADLGATFAAIERLRPDALYGASAPEVFGRYKQILEFARKARLPDTYWYSDMVTAGGLMAYSVGISDLGRRAAGYVDKILKGAKPGDLPLEQPTKFELVINLKTARALGIKIPPSILLRADRVIE